MENNSSWFQNIKRRWKKYRLGSVEKYYLQLLENPTYPFEDVGDGFYYILLRSDKFAFGIGTMIIALVCYISFSILIDWYSFPLILFLTVLGYGMMCLYGNSSHKELIINRYVGYALRIKGNDKVIVEEPISNIYIKLQRKFDSNLTAHFYLIVGGYRLDDIRLTGFCLEEKPIRLLGSKVAKHMGLNFFDVENNSTMHKIYHYPSQSLLSPPPEMIDAFLESHGLTYADVEEAKKNEGIPPYSDIVPNAIVQAILENYGQPEGTQRQATKLVKWDEKLNKTLETLLILGEERERTVGRDPYKKILRSRQSVESFHSRHSRHSRRLSHRTSTSSAK